MNMTSLIVGFMLGVVSTYIFTTALKKPRANENTASVKSSKFNPVLGVVLLVPIFASLIYWKAGNPDATSVRVPETVMPPMNTTQPMGGDGHEMTELGVMAQRLAEKLEKNPENADGWALLAHTYVEIKQHQNAIAAFEKATQMISNDPQLFADYADALAVTNSGKFDSKTTDLVEKALKIDPNHPKALLLAGTIAFKNADYTKAISIWEHLKPLISKEDTELMQDLANNIAEAKTLLKKK
jgi:cytochrome c-type biogenesis protein CcmH